MHPHTKPTIVVLVLCMVILGILLLPLPLTAYKVLQFVLSLSLLHTAGFFLRPCKKLMFTPSADPVEGGTRNPVDGSFSGSLIDSKTQVLVAALTGENSQIIPFLENGPFLFDRKPLPPISIKLSLGLILTAVIMNPFTRVNLPRASWMFLDAVVLALLGWALHVIREENAGNRPYITLTQEVGQPPAFPFMSIFDVFRHAVRLWPAIGGGIFAIALLGTKVGGGEFEDISLGHLLQQTMSALLASALLAWLVYLSIGTLANRGVAEKFARDQAPGEVFITVFVLIFMSFAFGGFFTPPPPYDPADAPEGYVPYERSDDY